MLRSRPLPTPRASLDRLRDAGVVTAALLAPFETDALALPLAGLRLTLLELAIGLAGGAALLGGLMTLSARGRAPRLGRLGAALLGLGLVLAASAALAPGPDAFAHAALRGGARSVALLSFVLAAAGAWRGPARRVLIGALAALAAAIVALGLFEQLAGDGLFGNAAVDAEAALLEPFRVKASVTAAGTRRLTATFAHANLAAAVLAAALAFAIGGATERRLLLRALGLGVALCLALTLSRGGLLAGAVAGVALALWPSQDAAARRERRLRLGLAGLAVALVALASPGLRARLLGGEATLVAATLRTTGDGHVEAANTGRSCWRAAGRDRHRLVARTADGKELTAVDAPKRLCPGASFALLPPAGTDHVRFEHHGLCAFATLALATPERPAPAAESAPAEARPAGRPALWRAALRLGGERPLLGWGPDTFRLRKGGDAREHANNVALEAFADAGALGVVALFAVLWAGLRIAWRRRSEAGPGRGAEAVAAAVLLAYATHGLLDCVLFFYGPVLPLCVALGVLLASEADAAAGDEGAN